MTAISPSARSLAGNLGSSKVGRTSVGYTWEIRSHDLLAIQGCHRTVYVGRGERPEPLPAERQFISAQPFGQHIQRREHEVGTRLSSGPVARAG